MSLFWSCFWTIRNGCFWTIRNGWQWWLQEFCLGCSYSTLKKFQVISVYFGCFDKYRPKFKIWLAWSLCLKKKKIVLKTKTNLHYVHQKTSKGKKKNEKKRKKWTEASLPRRAYVLDDKVSDGGVRCCRWWCFFL